MLVLHEGLAGATDRPTHRVVCHRLVEESREAIFTHLPEPREQAFGIVARHDRELLQAAAGRKQMDKAATILSWTSGFALMGYRGGALNLLATSIAMNLSLAPLIGIIASRRGRSGLRWAAAG